MADNVKGLNVHRARLARMRRAAKDEVLSALFAAGEKVRADAAESIKAGAISGPGHIPSAPGQPPNADTHNLDLSIDVRLNRASGTVYVIARAHYAAALEFGTSRIEPRPFMRPALQRNRSRIVYGMVQALNSTVRVYKSDTAFNNAASRFANSD